MMKGYAGRVLEIDLTTKTHSYQPLDEETAKLYIGGKGYGTRLLYDSTEAGIDPLGPGNPLIFATGPLNGSVAPQSNRFAVVTKSPLTGGIGNATCGGSFAYAMKRAGADLIVVTGRAERPTRIEIDGKTDTVTFLDASDLWGKGTYETQSLLDKKLKHAVIGPAGENMVRYAGIVSNERIAGRTGVGHVPLDPPPVDDRVADHRHDRRRNVRRDPTERVKDAGQFRLLVQGPGVRRLDDRPVEEIDWPLYEAAIDGVDEVVASTDWGQDGSVPR